MKNDDDRRMFRDLAGASFVLGAAARNSRARIALPGTGHAGPEPPSLARREGDQEAGQPDSGIHSKRGCETDSAGAAPVRLRRGESPMTLRAGAARLSLEPPLGLPMVGFMRQALDRLGFGTSRSRRPPSPS